MDPVPLSFYNYLFSFIWLSGIDSSYSYILVIYIPILLLLILCSGFISASEVAYFGLRPSELADLQETKSPKNKSILWLLEREEKLLATILISNNFVNIAIVVVFQIMFSIILPYSAIVNFASIINSNIFGDIFDLNGLSTVIQFLITTVFVTIILLTFGEIAPKILGNINKMRIASAMAGPLQFLMFLFSPFSKILTKWSSLLEHRIEKHRTSLINTSREDIDKAIDLTVSDNEGKANEADILKSIINFGETSVKQVMKPRVDIVSLDDSLDFTEMFKTVKEAGYSRLPVYKEDLDHISGILYVKDLLGHTNELKDWQWLSLVRKEVLYVPETKKIDQLLNEFQINRMHMAIVVNEFGGTMGIVTLEDIMEEIIGDIRDEFDNEQEIEFIKLDEDNYIFEGKTLLNDICKVIGIKNNYFEEIKENADSIGGLFVEIAGEIPKAEKEINIKGLTFKVISASERRVEKVSLRINTHEK